MIAPAPIVALLCLPPSAPPAEAPAGTTAPVAPNDAPVQLQAVILHGSDGLDPALADAVALRVGATPVLRAPLPADQARPTPPFAYVDLRPIDGATWEITLVVSDGRAYVRQVAVADRDPDAHRVVANHVANLVSAVEDGTAAPDREDATIPEPKVQTAEPAPVPPTPCPEPTPPPAAPPPAPQRIELGPSATVDNILGLGAPSDVDRFAGWGGSLGLAVRFPAGALLLADVRGSGRTGSGTRMTRVRAALGAGYAYRRRSLELGIAAMGTVEPWFVTQGAERVEFSGNPGTAPLLGGLLRLSPGLHVRTAAGPRLRVGVRADLAFSGDAAGGRTVVISDTDGTGSPTRLFRAGGVELATGVELQLWFPVGRERSPRRAPGPG